jgi:hypothetical protein
VYASPEGDTSYHTSRHEWRVERSRCRAPFENAHGKLQAFKMDSEMTNCALTSVLRTTSAKYRFQHRNSFKHKGSTPFSVNCNEGANDGVDENTSGFHKRESTLHGILTCATVHNCHMIAFPR